MIKHLGRWRFLITVVAAGFRTNPNRCEKCAGSAPYYVELADTGLCGRCGSIAEVIDPPLLRFYRRNAIRLEAQRHLLPRLRASSPTSCQWRSLGQIAHRIRALSEVEGK